MADDIQELKKRIEELEKMKGFQLTRPLDPISKEIINKTINERITKIRAYRTTSDQTIASGGGFHKVEFNAEEYDNQSEFDSTTNYRFTAKKSGYCQVNATVRWGSTVDQKRYFMHIAKNGTSYCYQILQGSGTEALTSSLNDIIKMTVGDYLEVFVQHNSGVNKDILATSEFTRFSIHKLS